jgi:POT family proton-dependent oligopeptide transporter
LIGCDFVQGHGDGSLGSIAWLAVSNASGKYMAIQNPPVSQTKSFSTVFLIEMWERFGFYGMQVLMVTYMVKKLGFADIDANLVWGAASALIYATPAIGGWIGDKFLGTRRTMLTGAVVLMFGYALLWIPTNNAHFLYLALGVIILGNGMFKPNAGNLVRKIYEGDEVRIDSAFTIYYMAVNIGSTVSMILTPWIRDYVGEHYGDALGWHTAFGVCSIGLIFGLVNYFFMRRTLAHVGSTPDEHPPVLKNVLGIIVAGAAIIGASAYILQNQGVAQACVYAAGVAILLIFVHLIRSSGKGERAGLIAALVLTIQTIFFFIFYQQMSTSLNLFAQRNVDLQFSLFGWNILTWIPEQFQSLNAIWIVILSPILVWLYNTLGKHGKDFPVAAKFALGFAAVAAGFFMYGLGATTAIAGKISSWYMVWGYGLYSLGEVLVSGLGLAMIARYVPARMGGFMMGAYYVASGVAQYMGSVVANYAAIPDNITDPLQSLTIYTSLFNKLGMVGILCTAIAVGMLPLMKKLSLNHALANVPPFPPVHNEDL